MRTLWLRLRCWWNDICFKHKAPKDYHRLRAGGYWYCSECEHERAAAQRESYERLLEEVKGL